MRFFFRISSSALSLFAVLMLALALATPSADAGWRRGGQCQGGSCQTAQVAPAGYSYSATVTTTATYSYQASDPLATINSARATYGLPPLAFDPALASVAAANNAHQAARGMGHFVRGGALQVASGTSNPGMSVSMWLGSRIHRSYLLHPNMRFIGFSFSGGYGTAELR